jgi:cytochrome P450 family 142 subfamily A polypeptide 1
VGDASLLPSAVEEMLRWVSPIKTMARTATVDVELEGVAVPAGARLALLYESADFDERHFDDPERFDITRSPNDHLAFGFGHHFCLGASLARVELEAIVGRVLARMPDLELATGDPLPRSITGIEAMPVRFTPSARRARDRS